MEAALAESNETTDAPVSPLTNNNLAVCELCGHAAHWLGEHVALEHDLGLDEYLSRFPNAELSSQDTKAVNGPEPSVPEHIFLDIKGVPFQVNLRVPQEACAPMPPHYRLPQHGQLSDEIEDTLLAMQDPWATLFIFGRGGSGKDAFGEYWSAATRTPFVERTIQPDADVEAWFFYRDFNAESTFWHEGPLLKALRDGYQPPDGGPVVPYILKLTDGDRATPRQAEFLRLLLDSSNPRIPGPLGQTYPVLPGTRIMVTANTNGAGDISGRHVSARPQDATLMERYHAVFEFPYLDWEDEKQIIRSKFPLFVREGSSAQIEVNGSVKTVDLIEQVGKVVRKIRDDIQGGKLYTDFSHRHLCWWLKHAQHRINHEGVTTDLLARSAKVWLTRIGDSRTKLEVKKIMDAHISGGVLNRKRN